MINIMPELTPVFTAYEALVAEADAVFARVGEMHPDCVTCKPGCSDCCHAMFDLSLVEAMYLNGSSKSTTSAPSVPVSLRTPGVWIAS